MSTTMKHGISLTRWSVFSLAAMSVACAASELEVPANHPAHPAARSGQLPKTTKLGSPPAGAEPAAGASSQHSGHGEHEH